MNKRRNKLDTRGNAAWKYACSTLAKHVRAVTGKDDWKVTYKGGSDDPMIVVSRFITNNDFMGDEYIKITLDHGLWSCLWSTWSYTPGRKSNHHTHELSSTKFPLLLEKIGALAAVVDVLNQ